MALGAIQQSNIAVNKARHLVFFEGSDLAYNYATQQWTSTPGYTGIKPFPLNSKSSDIGLIRYSSGSVSLQRQLTTYPALDAVIATGATDPNVGGRGVVTGVRPLSIGGTHTVRIGTQDAIGGTVTYTSAITPNTRSGMANFRAEGRYVRVEHTITGGFTTALGADVEFAAHGRL